MNLSYRQFNVWMIRLLFVNVDSPIETPIFPKSPPLAIAPRPFFKPILAFYERINVGLLSVSGAILVHAQAPAQQPRGDQPSKAAEGPLLNPMLELHENELGIKVGEPIDSGFVFVDGVYVEPPYVVARRGWCVFINDRLVRPPFLPWPLPGEDKTIGIVDPEISDEITAKTLPHDPALVEYLSRKLEFVRRHTAPTHALAALTDVYQKLPCVVEAHADSVRREIVVTWTDGTVQNITAFPPTGRRINWTKERLIQELEENYRGHWEKRLQKGDVYFFWSSAGRSTGGPGYVEKTFPEVVRILRTSASDEEKIAQLTDPKGPGVNPIDAPRLVATFSAPPELEARIAEAIEKIRQDRAARQERGATEGVD